MRSALLRGREHQRLGGIELIAEGPCAITLSLGGAKKTYAHVDPNEDAALFALGESGQLIAVADGHGGAEASEVVLDYLLESPAAQWTGKDALDEPSWQRHALAALVDANAAILREARPSRSGPCRTTLVAVLIRPGENRLFYAAIGDSHLFHVTPFGVEDLAAEVPSTDAADFLGHAPETQGTLAGKSVVASRPLDGTRAVVLATDGLTERYIGVDQPEYEVSEALERAAEALEELRPSVAVRALTEATLRAHVSHRAGDNIATAVWLPSPPG